MADASKAESLLDNKRKEDIHSANINAGRAVADAVRMSLGPKGMDKIISTANAGATILNKMDVLQPAAKMLVELSISQHFAAGDGTTTVLAGALLRVYQSLLASGIHPKVISDALHKSCAKSVDILTAMDVPVELTDRESLVKRSSFSNLRIPPPRRGDHHRRVMARRNKYMFRN